MKNHLITVRRWLLVGAGLAAMPAAVLASPLPAWAPMAATSEATLAGVMAPVSGGGFDLAREAADTGHSDAPANPCDPGAAPANPCAPKNPCGEAPANPCNPCGAYNESNPCGTQAKNPCNPCSATAPPMAAAAKAKSGNSMVLPGILGLAALFMAVKSLGQKKA